MNSYNPDLSVRWAVSNVHAYQRRPDLCAWYLTQSCWAGGLPQEPGIWEPQNIAGEPPGTPTAVRCHLLWRYLVGRGYAKEEVVYDEDCQPDNIDASPGDMLIYDWNGILHGALVVGKPKGKPIEVAEWGLASRSGLRSAYPRRPWLWSANANAPLSDKYPNQTILLLRMM